MSAASHPEWRKLTRAEERVIVHQGTELPGSGEYEHNTRPGTYVCKRCRTPLYRSDDKFDAGCGWPSFDQELPGRVRRIPDRDGSRVEIRCANCDGHLGHEFLGERFTPKNARHCVNSVSLLFVPATPEAPPK
jgi:methionine-R-sulfoxide reductase